jgi:AraC family transcriptional regulator, exoenzyme S synthesis regulatory protein ExsA
MLNLQKRILSNPGYFKQLACGEALLTLYNCPLENKFVDIWSQANYIVYVVEGKKIWHTPNGSYELRKDDCVFVRKGACIVEQFFDVTFCFMLFFVPDEFICDVLKSKDTPLYKPEKKYKPIINIQADPAVRGFFNSMMPHFEAGRQPDKSLLELKFKELILTLADNASNMELLSYFCSLLKAPQAMSLQRVMDDNFCYNLKLEEFAELSNRSLSAFKRDFQKLYNTTPGKWLLEKRLHHSMHLLKHVGKTVGEASFESGFENPSHFSRSFRKHFGTAPASVRQ